MSLCVDIASRDPVAEAVCRIVEEKDPSKVAELRTPEAVFDEAIRIANLEFKASAEALRNHPGARLQLPFLEAVRGRGGVLFPWIPFDPGSLRDEGVVGVLLRGRDRLRSSGQPPTPQAVLDFLIRPDEEGGMGFRYGEFELDPERGALELFEEPSFTNCAEWTSPTYLVSILWDLPVLFIMPGPGVHSLPAIETSEGPVALDLERRAVYVVRGGRMVSPRFLIAAHHHNRSFGGNCGGEPTPLRKVECQLQEARLAVSVAPEEGLFVRQRDELSRQRERLRSAAEESRRTGHLTVVDY